MRRIVVTMLHGFGVRVVHEAEDGITGLKAAGNLKPDIIITDSLMPAMDGMEFTRAIRNPKSKLNCFVPIIMLTGATEQWRVLSARDVGVTEFLSKPVSAKALYQRIVTTLTNPKRFVKTEHYFGPDWGQHVAPANDRAAQEERQEYMID
ncbi:MAG: response regulator [Hyphomicrobiales bacterium]|nr:response regulator [Hyphomicrobiales bacterium]